MAAMQADSLVLPEEDFTPKHKLSKDEQKFDLIIGELENILMGFIGLILRPRISATAKSLL